MYHSAVSLNHLFYRFTFCCFIQLFISLLCILLSCSGMSFAVFALLSRQSFQAVILRSVVSSCHSLSCYFALYCFALSFFISLFFYLVIFALLFAVLLFSHFRSTIVAPLFSCLVVSIYHLLPPLFCASVFSFLLFAAPLSCYLVIFVCRLLLCGLLPCCFPFCRFLFWHFPVRYVSY